MKVYTKTGDKGTTSLAGGKRINKSDIQIESYGTIDELGAVVGVCIEELKELHTATMQQTLRDEVVTRLENIQQRLFTVGGILATETDKWDQYWTASVLIDWTTELENWIDQYSVLLPDFKSFIMQRGSRISAYMHVARTICRRAERQIIRFYNENSLQNDITDSLLKLVNRLSDFLFILARLVLKIENKNEIYWK